MKFSIFLFFLLISLYGHTQQSMSSYFMRENYLRNESNPALRPSRGYLALPGIGDVSLNVASNSFSVDNLLYPDPTGDGVVTFLDPRISGEKLLQEIKSENRLSISTSINMLSAGFYTRSNFITLSLKTKMIGQLTLPEEFFRFAKIGPGKEGEVYNMRNIQLESTGYTELGIGISKPISKKITIGTRVKFLAGLMNYNVKYNNLRAEFNKNQWITQAQGELQIAANQVTPDPETNESGTPNNYISYGDFELKPKGPASYGFALDMGLTYSPSRNLTISAGVVDFGYLWWQKKSILQANAVEEFRFDGAFEVVNGVIIPKEHSSIDINEITRFVPSEAKAFTTRIEPVLNAGIEYSILRDHIGLGLLSSTTFGNVYTTTQLLLSANFRPTSWFTGTVSYALLRNQFDTFGVALNFHPSWINFFIGSDHIGTRITPQFLPVSAKNVNLFIGVGIPLGKAPIR